LGYGNDFALPAGKSASLHPHDFRRYFVTVVLGLPIATGQKTTLRKSVTNDFDYTTLIFSAVLP
jgi:hypothetical protein